jgi:ankyrin repeat protein
VSKFAAWPAPMQEKVTEVVATRSEGVYLLASFVIEELKHCQVVEIDQTLAEFPTELRAIYLRMLEQILQNRRSVAVMRMKWVLCARRPLSLSELSVITGVRPAAGQSIDEAVADQVSFCNHILEVTDGFVYPCHSSVRDFLLDPQNFEERIPGEYRFDLHKTHCEIGDICLRHLEKSIALSHSGHGSDRQETSEDLDTCYLSQNPHMNHIEILPAYPLVSYAIPFTLSHVVFFDVPSWEVVLQRVAWKKHEMRRDLDTSRFIYARDNTLQDFLSCKSKNDLSIFQFATASGLLRLARCLLDRSGSLANRELLLDQQNNVFEETPLMVACKRRDITVVQYLVDQGASIELGDYRGLTTLTIACEHGHEDVINFLIDSKANVNGQSHCRHKQQMLRSPVVPTSPSDENLAVALRQVRSRTQNIASRIDSIIDSKLTVYTPIHAAVTRCSKKVVTLLIEAGASVNVRDSIGKTPISYAILDGYSDM